MMKKYTIGVDFGTLSGRAVLVEVNTGEEVMSSVYDYPHAVMDKSLPDGTLLGVDWALQHPQDYLDVFAHTIPELIKLTGVAPEDIIGVGTDFTACTVLPVLKDGTPLCFLDKYRSNPHAYIKLWKHHAAQDKANELNRIAEVRGEKWLARYGGKISSEWAIPKLWQILDEAPEVYAEMAYFIEAADWVIWQLCGVQTRNSCTAGYKEIWHKTDGYPSKEFFKALDPRLENVVEDKLNCPITPLGQKAGSITEEAAKLTGLKVGTAVAVGNVDAHVTIPAVKIDSAAKILGIMGTSTCHILLGDQERIVPGMCGVVEDGVLPGFYGYEAGQSCVGDHFAWFVNNCLPESYSEAAKKKGINVQQYLTEKASQLAVGESGLVALDWWNGNRSVLVDVDLTGMILGLTLQSKPEEIYRALIEATAYGTRKIIETFRNSGVPVDEFYASGGISQKNPMAMQIYADICNIPVKIAGSTQGPALGSAIFAAVAAGKAEGGYDDIFNATKKMGNLKDIIYQPMPEHVTVYDKLYAEYDKLHDYFGRGANDVMKRLKAIKKEATK
jgi:L-ribulokinase